MSWRSMAATVRGQLESPGGAQVERALKRAARDLCRRTGVLVEELAALDAVAGEVTYAVAASTGYELRRVKTVTLNGNEVDASQWRYAAAVRSVVLSMAPAADATGGLVVAAVVAPLVTISADLPAWFEERWGDVIEAGALVRLMGQRRKAWFDADGAADARSKWRAGESAARRDVRAQGRDGTLAYAPPLSGGWK